MAQFEQVPPLTETEASQHRTNAVLRHIIANDFGTAERDRRQLSRVLYVLPVVALASGIGTLFTMMDPLSLI